MTSPSALRYSSFSTGQSFGQPRRLQEANRSGAAQIVTRQAGQIGSLAGGIVKGCPHKGSVFGRCAAAASNQADSGFGEGQGILTKIFGRGGIHQPASPALRPTGIGLRRETHIVGQELAQTL